MWEMDPEWKYFMEIDLKDGFFGISVDERLSKLFGFTYGDRMSRGSEFKWMMMHPLRISATAAVGRSRQGRLNTCGGPSQSKDRNADAAAIASEPSPDALTHSTVHWTNRLQDTRMAIAPKWRSQMFITPVTSSDQMYEET